MIRKILLTALILVAGMNAFAQEETVESYDFKYKFEQGDQYQVTLQTQQESYLTVNGTQSRTTNQRQAQMLFSVQSVNHLEATIAVSYEKLVLISSSSDNQISVNTETEDNGLYNRLFKPLIGKKFTVVLQANGTVKSVSSLSSIFDEMIAAVPEVKSGEKKTLKQFLDAQFGADALKAELAKVLPYYPVRTVQLNGSWSNILYTDGFYHARINNYWKLDFGDKMAINLSNKGRFVSDSTETVDLGGGNTGYVDLKGEMRGKYLLDPETYWPTSCITNTELSGNYIYLNPKKKKKNVTVPVRVVMNASYKFKHL